MTPVNLLEENGTLLKARGFDLLAILPLSRLPQTIQQLLVSADLPVTGDSSLVLIGNAGKALWNALTPLPCDQDDPIDSYSMETAQQFADRVFGKNAYQMLYPLNNLLPLQQLGEQAGWHTPSPFGIGVNARWGPWFAYRCLLLTNCRVEQKTEDYGPPPCTCCIDKPCITACPAAALYSDRPMDMSCCARYRLQQDSPCADRCLARMSCPVANNEAYPLEQIKYHYRLSLETLRHYYN